MSTNQPSPISSASFGTQGRFTAIFFGGIVAGMGLAAILGRWVGAVPSILALLLLLVGALLIAWGVRTTRRATEPSQPSLATTDSTVAPTSNRSRDQTDAPAPMPAPPLQPSPAPPANSPARRTEAPENITTGPRVVAIGGGTGMPQLLRGLRAYTDHITAVVTVADDGGSSGRLRRQMGVLPPGDFRNNIAALSEAEELMTRLFQYRFADSEVSGRSELAGHSFGNLFITTMAAVAGSFEAGLAESSRVLAVRGRVLPSTLEHITLCAEVCFTRLDGGEFWQVVEGESNITEAGGRIMRVFLKPDMPRAYPAVIRAILQADLIVAGPGSFFTSVMPNLLVPAVRDAICAAPAPRIYLCNVATQAGETDHYTVADHMRQLHYHAPNAFNTVLANQNYDPNRPPSANSNWVTLPAAAESANFQLFTGDVVDRQYPWRHDSARLAARLMEVYRQLRSA